MKGLRRYDITVVSPDEAQTNADLRETFTGRHLKAVTITVLVSGAICVLTFAVGFTALLYVAVKAI